MSDFDDYLGEMARTKTTDAEIERLLSGASGVSDDLQPLAQLFAALRAGDELADDEVASFATAAASSVVPGEREPVVAPRVNRPLLTALRRRAATVAMAAAVFIGGTSGLAVAADGAKPGDALYGVDRALEAIGIGAGAQQERLSEAEALVDSGEVRRGLEHAAKAVEETEPSGSGAAAALLQAATRVGDAGADPAAETHASVAGLLAYLSANAGNIDGARVAELARQIGGPDGTGAPGPPDGVPADPPGLTDREPGPPDNVPADPPGLTDREPGPPDDVPADPPGLTDREPGPPSDVPADPPGLSDTKPGRTDPPRNEP